MTAQNPNQSTGRESGPRFDDRPTTQRENEGPDAGKGTTKERAGETPSKGPDLPDYGDQEPGDPRRIEIENRRSERQGGGARS